MSFAQYLSRIRTAQRKAMPIVESLEDLDIVCEIGTNPRITARDLLAKKIGAPATVRRRLERLVKIGIVLKTHDANDKREWPLRLSKQFERQLEKLGTTIGHKE